MLESPTAITNGKNTAATKKERGKRAEDFQTKAMVRNEPALCMNRAWPQATMFLVHAG